MQSEVCKNGRFKLHAYKLRLHIWRKFGMRKYYAYICTSENEKR